MILASVLSALLAATVALAATGDSSCTPYFCLNATHDGVGTLTYNLVAKTGVQVGWIGVGEGTQMQGAKMYISWPSTAGGNVVVFSERAGPTGPNHNPPTPVTDPISTFQTSLSTSNTTTFQSTWSRPLTSPSSSFNMIWSYQVGTPPGSTASATIQTQHKDFGTMVMNLAKTLGTDGKTETGSVSASGADGRFGNLIVVHGALMVAAYAVISPCAILIARFGRAGVIPKWVLGHQILQSGLTFPFTIAGFALAVVSVQRRYSGHFSETHEIMGLTLFILLPLQLLLGGFIHHKFSAARLRRPIRNWIHMVLGIAMQALAAATIYKGLELYGEERWRTILYWCWVGVMAALFVLGYALIPKQLKREQAIKENDSGRVISGESGRGMLETKEGKRT